MIKKWTLLKSKDILTTPYIQIEQRTYKLPDDSVRDDYYHLKRPDFVIIVAITEENQILVIRQYRRGIDRATVELPAGWLDKDESSADTAIRELYEETGFQGSNPTLLGKLAAQPSFSDMHGYVMALDIGKHKSKVGWQEHSHANSDDETVEHTLLTKTEINGLIKSGDFCDMGSIAALRLAGL